MARKKRMSGKKYGAGKGAPKMAGKPAILSLSRVTGKVAPSVKRGKITVRGKSVARKATSAGKKRGRGYR
tara:strand:+ start:12209 stop:12418 length:210 start_codon:yes stop_codon:yes gene_type:complete